MRATKSRAHGEVCTRNGISGDSSRSTIGAPAGRRTFAEADATRRETLAEVFDDLLDDGDIAALEAVRAKLKGKPQVDPAG
ncbi:hypothetical protein ACIBEA_23075 [Streptomyces sp. NPDC051555]|uniref:hypothetical protein n=1 Tax=Streptomyces sp. NPDC051555 TaxID=3365657 RepID=UPI0037AF0033